ncbi:hypothetical protein K474DRAFT_1568399, partial [Panus rudis PR-1116 ss-1]
RGTPRAVLDALPAAVYSEWAVPGETEESCPICLDEYAQTDPVLRIPACRHWFHRTCLHVR